MPQRSPSNSKPLQRRHCKCTAKLGWACAVLGAPDAAIYRSDMATAVRFEPGRQAETTCQSLKVSGETGRGLTSSHDDCLSSHICHIARVRLG